ncbi:MAG: hypothetical protein BM564_04870 [Bacteroidetes bacterium MedPE-SWsnd-G2]|nr:MAG: hypothetical protein BM564_04870 [Bacteroidetes bacterium MedPE-SWsnd-G2]
MAVCIANKEIEFTKPMAVKLPKQLKGKSEVKQLLENDSNHEIESEESQYKIVIELKHKLKRVGIRSAVIAAVQNVENSVYWMNQFKGSQLHKGCYMSRVYFRGMWFNVYANNRDK